MKNVEASIEEIRYKLNYLISTDADYSKILEVSTKLDKLIALYYKDAEKTSLTKHIS